MFVIEIQGLIFQSLKVVTVANEACIRREFRISSPPAVQLTLCHVTSLEITTSSF